MIFYTIYWNQSVQQHRLHFRGWYRNVCIFFITSHNLISIGISPFVNSTDLLYNLTSHSRFEKPFNQYSKDIRQISKNIKRTTDLHKFYHSHSVAKPLILWLLKNIYIEEKNMEYNKFHLKVYQKGLNRIKNISF